MTSDASPPRDKDDRERSRLERIVPDLVRKIVDVGVEKLADGPENLKQLLSDLKLPKEAISVLTSHLDETKREVTQVLAREIREFLESASLADELTKLLSGLTLEVKTQIRFVPSDTGHLRPKTEVRTKLGVQVDTPTPAEHSHVNSFAEPAVGSRSNPPSPKDTQVKDSAPISTDLQAEQERTL